MTKPDNFQSFHDMEIENKEFAEENNRLREEHKRLYAILSSIRSTIELTVIEQEDEPTPIK